MSKRIRIVSYAINGRGMGHLTRQLAILRWVRRITTLLNVPTEIWLLTSSEADTLARREGFCALKMPSKAMMRDANVPPARYLAIARTWVMNAIAGLQPDLLMVDTFPGGSFGELVTALELAKHRVLVARRVRPGFAEEDSYQALLPLYTHVITPDASQTGPIVIRDRGELKSREAARSALGIPEGKRAVYVSMGGGGDRNAPSILPRLVRMLVDRDWHVVVGAGPLYDGEELRGANITWLDRYTPVELLPGVDAAVSAGGYNSFHELMFVGVPTVFVPQTRIADDQEERCARAEAAGAGRVAAKLQDVPDLLENPGSADAARSMVPDNGARNAAMIALSGLVPDADLRLAKDVLTPDLVALIGRWDGEASGTTKALELVRLLAGGTPSDLAKRRALLLDLAEQGHEVPTLPNMASGAADRVARFGKLCDQVALPPDQALKLLNGLRRKFPAATPEDLVLSCEVLFPSFGRFDDWMGAISLLRAVPTQRTLTLHSFAQSVTDWLAQHDDLFEAVRDFSRLEGSGRRPVAEVLHLLGRPDDVHP